MQQWKHLNKITVFQGDYIGVNPYDETDTIDLRNGYEENKNASAPSFSYILKDVITIETEWKFLKKNPVFMRVASVFV